MEILKAVCGLAFPGSGCHHHDYKKLSRLQVCHQA
jgi:hypothetical protein